METKYAVYNPQTGENILYGTKEEALQQFWANVIYFAKTHFHNTAYMVVEKNNDGTERWFNDNNEEIERLVGPLNDEIQNMMKYAMSLEEATPVETLP